MVPFRIVLGVKTPFSAATRILDFEVEEVHVVTHRVQTVVLGTASRGANVARCRALVTHVHVLVVCLLFVLARILHGVPGGELLMWLLLLLVLHLSRPERKCCFCFSPCGVVSL